MKTLAFFIAVTAISLSMSAQIPDYVPEDGLVAWYPFNGNASDESGNGLNGEVNGATLTSDRYGNASSAYSFSNGNFIEVPNSTSLNYSNDISFTISAWIKLDGPQSAYSGIVTKMAEGAIGFQFVVGNNVTSDVLATEFGEGPVGAGATGNIDLNDDSWHNVVYVVNRLTNKISLYVDNVLDSETIDANISLANIDNFENMKIGVERLMTFYFNGKIDDVAIWDRALAENEINILYEGEICVPSYLSQDGLVAYYPFCGSANDESGNGFHGMVNGALLTEDRNGLPNAAYHFDGIDDFIQISSDDNLLDFFNVDEISISAWINLENSGEQYGIVTNTSYDSIHQQYAFKIESTGQLYFISGDGLFESNGTNVGDAVLSLDEWTHVVMTYDANTIKFYIDGELDFSNDVVDAFPEFPSEYLFLGQSWGENNANFPGKLDDIAIYSRALSAYEISELFDASSVECVPDYLPTNELVAWYPFCGDANDQGGHGLDGIVNGAVLTADRYGNEDEAYSFDGVDDYIEVADTSLLDFGTENFSVCFWVKKLALSNGDNSQGVNKWYGDPLLSEWSLSIGTDNTEQPLFTISTAGESFVAASDTDIELDQWTHIIGVRDDDFLLLFMNGILVGSTNIGDAEVQNVGRNLLFGTIQGGIDTEDENVFSNACLDDIAIYSRALNPAEITSISSDTPLGVCDDCYINWSQGDLDCNGEVTTADLLLFLTHYGDEVEE